MRQIRKRKAFLVFLNVRGSKLIISASRRTDLPAFFGEWFKRRVEEKNFVSVNPFNPKQRKEISLEIEAVDAFIFWSKNPEPFLKYLPIIDNYSFYFQFTLNNYPKIFEPNLPSFGKRVDTFKKLSDIISPARVILRYDPIILSNKTDYSYHLKAIDQILSTLTMYTKTLMVSFVTPYKKIQKRMNIIEQKQDLIFQTPLGEEVKDFACKLAQIGNFYNIKVNSCSESMFEGTEIQKGCCIDGDLINEIKGTEFKFKKDSNQRAGCGCVKSVDMGVYNTCSFNCAYCYANYTSSGVIKNLKRYDPTNQSMLS